MRKLGTTQENVLRCLKEHKSWHRGGGWYWDTDRNTERVLDSLVKRGLVSKDEKGVYRPC